MEKKETSKEYNAAYLKKVSIYGGVLSFFNSEEEAKAFTRQFYFSDFNSSAALHYTSLSEKNRNLIGRLANKLSRGREHRGFNLYLYLYWLTKSYESEPKLTIAQISKNLQMVDNELFDYCSVSIWLNKIQDRPNLHENSKYFGYLKDNLLFSTELITKGVGYIDIVKPNIVEEYYNYSEASTKHRAYDDDIESLTGISVREKLERFAAYTGRKWEELVDRYYCAISYTYSYASLDESSQKLVDEFIEMLYGDNKGAEMLVGLYQNSLDGTIEVASDDE